MLLALDLLTVDPEHQRRGAGRLLVQWGTSLADELGFQVRNVIFPSTLLSNLAGRRWLKPQSTAVICTKRKDLSSSNGGRRDFLRSGRIKESRSSSGWSGRQDYKKLSHLWYIRRHAEEGRQKKKLSTGNKHIFFKQVVWGGNAQFLGLHVVLVEYLCQNQKHHTISKVL